MANRELQNKTNITALNASLAYKRKHNAPQQWGVMFLTESGAEFCREMGSAYRFHDYPTAVRWVQENVTKAHPAITGFYVFCW